MSIFIKTTTGEYPRHIGDIYLDVLDFNGDVFNLPEGWAAVVNTEPPIVKEGERYFEVAPIFTEGAYIQAWDVRPLTAQEIQESINPSRGLWELPESEGIVE
jgi:hypothetical protein